MEKLYKEKLEPTETFEKRRRFTNLDEETFEKETKKQKEYKKRDHYRAN